MASNVIRCSSRLSLAPVPVDEARKLVSVINSEDLDYKFLVLEVPSSEHTVSESPMRLGKMFWFKNLIDNILGDNQYVQLLICGSDGPHFVTTACCLLGAYLILMENQSVEELTAIFDDVLGSCGTFQEDLEECDSDAITVVDIWMAVEKSKSIGWLNFKDEQIDIDRCLDMHEYLHYDSEANGAFHVVIPSKIIAFNVADDLDSGTDWMSERWVDRGGHRQFGPRFYAEILAEDYDVKLLVRCDQSSPIGSIDPDDDSKNEDAPPFRDAFPLCFEELGVGVEQLDIIEEDGGLCRWGLLREIDRFLTLLKHCPGPVAIVGRSGRGRGSAVELLITTVLIKEYGFEPGTAVAWVRVVHPQGPQEDFGLTLEEDPDSGSEDEWFEAMSWRSASHASITDPATRDAELAVDDIAAAPQPRSPLARRGSAIRSPLRSPMRGARPTSSAGDEPAAGARPRVWWNSSCTAVSGVTLITSRRGKARQRMVVSVDYLDLATPVAGAGGCAGAVGSGSFKAFGRASSSGRRLSMTGTVIQPLTLSWNLKALNIEL